MKPHTKKLIAFAVAKKLLMLALIFTVGACAGTQGTGLQPRVSNRATPISADGTIEVQRGDTVYSIARRYGVAMSSVISENSLKAPYVLQPGQRVRIPAGGAINSNDSGTYAQMPYDRSIASEDIGSASLAPMAADSQPQQKDAAVSAEPLDGNQGETKLVLTPLGPSTTPMGDEMSPTKLTPDAPAVADSTPAVAAKPGMFGWPLEGRVISNYGAQAGGVQNDGINIAAPRGTPVSSAAGGTVVHAGSEVGNLGNLVLIRHPDGYVTAYGHLDRVLVDKDTVVGANEVIGTVGETGGVKSPQLHFEIRQGEKPLDPMQFLGSR